MRNHHNFITSLLIMSMIFYGVSRFIDINQKMYMLSSTPIYVKFGGINGGLASNNWGTISLNDYSNIPRSGTVDALSAYGWSMGAYEYDNPINYTISHPNSTGRLNAVGNDAYIGGPNKTNSINITFDQSMDFRKSQYAAFTNPINAPPAEWAYFLDWTNDVTGLLKDNVASLEWSTDYKTLYITPGTPNGWGPDTGTQGLVIESDSLFVWNQTETLLGSDINEMSYTVDLTAPNVALLADWDASPGNGDQIIGSGSNIYVKFTESMSGCSITAITRNQVPTSPQLIMSIVTNDTYRLSPPGGGWLFDVEEDNLFLSLSCKDLAGNSFTGNTTYTHDGTAPTRSISPAAGSLNNVSQAITITFSEPIDTAATTGTVSPNGAGYTLTWSGGNTVLTLAPTTVWNQGTFGFSLTCYDLNGNGVTAAASYNIDTIGPSITGRNPSGGIYDVCYNSNIVISFNESIASATVTSCNDMNGNPASVTPTGTTVTIAPPSGFVSFFGPSGIGSLLQIDLTVTDSAGNSSSHDIDYTTAWTCGYP